LLNNAVIKLLIFDLDDTLIKSYIDYQAIRKQIVELFNSPSRNLIENSIASLLERLQTQFPEKLEEAYKRIDTLEGEALSKAKMIFFSDRIPALIKRFQLSSAILTNNSRKGVNKYLASFPFLNSFYILTRDDIPTMKPNPIGITTIIKKFQQTDPKLTIDQTAYVGDSFIDSQAAFMAGIRFIWYNSRQIDTSKFPNQPYQTINQLSDLEAILMQTNN